MRKGSRPTLPMLQRELILRREGTAAVEFALLMPVMLTLFFGAFEITNLLMVNLKLTAATEAAADLVAQTRSQTPNIAPSDIGNFTTAADLVITPYAASGLKLAYAGLTYNSNGNPQVAWHYEENGATAITTGALNQTLLQGLGSGTASVIMVQSTYNYTSPFSWVLGTTYTLGDIAYNRPRYVTQVTCTTC
jgi:Flp pilus assembly protein TadG